jgi:PAS domain S-box-containing protein
MLEAMLAASIDGLLLERPDGTVLRANEEACRMLGYGEAELAALGRGALLGEGNTPGAALFEERAARGKARGVILLRRKDGSSLEAEVSTALFADAQGLPCASVHIHDLTRQLASERQARETAEQMRFALDAAELGYWTFNTANGQGYRSPSMFRCLGHADPVPGWTHEDFLRQLHPDDVDRVMQADRTAREGRQDYEAEFRVIWPDGSVHWLSARGRYYFDEAGKPVRMSGVQFDVTKRKAAEMEMANAQARFRNVFELSEDGILIHRRRIIRYANHAAARMLGASSPQGLVGLVFTDFVVPELRERAIQRREDIIERGGSVPYMESRLVRMDGEVIDVEIAGSAVWEEGEAIIHTQIRDIAERKRHEREILALNHTLEARVEARTRELEAANRELESYSYMVAHDLRAPLRAVSGFSGMLKETLGERLGEEEQRYMGFILANVERMNKLIEGLLQFSRSGRGTLGRQRIEARTLVESVIHDLQSRGNAQFEVGALPALYADPVLLHQIFVNLLDNAMKYSRGREQPRIEVAAGEEDGADVIVISDNGVGFDPAYGHKLFGVFQRLHAQTEFEGTGVGLAIVRKIVERHGGRVWAEGEVDKGARFCFTIPRQA